MEPMEQNWFKLVILSIVALGLLVLVSEVAIPSGPTGVFIVVAMAAVFGTITYYVGRGIGFALADTADE